MPPLNDKPSATETAADQLGADTPAADTPAPGGDTPAADTPAADLPAADLLEGDEAAASAKPGSKTAALLESMSEPAPGAKPAATEETKPGDKPADKPAAEKPTPEQEEAELLEGVKSPRGQERIKQVFAEKKQLETDIGEFRELINSTGMKPEEFAQTLEFGRLVNSGTEADTRVALEMLEAQRTALYAKLGVEAPGVDLLTDHPDLQKQVTDLEITRERAVELAKFRKTEGARVATETRQRELQQNTQEYERTVTTAAGQMEAYLETRKNEVDHPARMRVISDHFRNPENLKAFVETYRPEQWGPTMRMMYDNIKLASPAPTREQQPLRSRPANLGNAAAAGVAPIDRIASRMDAMGL
ncbi:MAG: hypothetical protein ACRC7C_19660 [Beijerinckiaceae bacterium]